MSGTRVYVGNLDERLTERDLEDEFGRHGTLRNVWVARRPPGFAFLEFEDPRDAEEAVRKLDGFRGWRVEVSRSAGRNPPPGEGGARRGGPPGPDTRCYECGQPGHFARECRARRGAGGGRRYDDDRRYRRDYSRSRSRSPRGRRSRSRSRSRDRYRRRSSTPPRERRGRDYSRSRSRGRSASRSPPRRSPPRGRSPPRPAGSGSPPRRGGGGGSASPRRSG